MFISLKIAIFKFFNDEILKHVSFFTNLYLLTINEMHLISKWSTFCSKYFDLEVFHAKLFAKLSLLSIFAIINAKTLIIVKDWCNFSSDIKIIKTALNHFEIYIQINSLQMFAINMLDLQHILSVQVNDSLNIFKIIIFMNFIKIINNVCTLMHCWMNQLLYSHDFKNWVTSFFFNMISINKTKIAIFFKKSLIENTTSWILIATNVYELNVDNFDVARVLQWLLSSSMSKLYQHLS